MGEKRGFHNCFWCGHEFEWILIYDKGPAGIHAYSLDSNSVKAEALIVGDKPKEFEIHASCPRCSTRNSFNQIIEK